MSDEEPTRKARKPKQRVFYKEDAAGLWVYLQTGKEVVLLTPTPLRMAYADYLRDRLEPE